jgi:hypothetical protein
MEADLALLPRRLRAKRSSRKLEGAYRKVVDKTAKVRDMDVLKAKLSGPMDQGARRADGRLEAVGGEGG